jgi:hypothetical protein
MLFLRWYRQWRERRRLGGRGLFRYWDGSRFRYGDPAVIWRSLLNHPRMNLETMIPLAEQGQEPEATIVTEALCEIFDVQYWDGQAGLTTWEVMDLVPQFEDYLTALKKNTSPSRMPLQLMAFGSSTSPEPPDEPPNSTADCSSTPNASNCDEGGACCGPSRPH